jgi:hypothetical protein
MLWVSVSLSISIFLLMPRNDRRRCTQASRRRAQASPRAKREQRLLLYPPRRRTKGEEATACTRSHFAKFSPPATGRYHAKTSAVAAGYVPAVSLAGWPSSIDCRPWPVWQAGCPWRRTSRQSWPAAPYATGLDQTTPNSLAGLQHSSQQ